MSDVSRWKKRKTLTKDFHQGVWMIEQVSKQRLILLCLHRTSYLPTYLFYLVTWTSPPPGTAKDFLWYNFVPTYYVDLGNLASTCSDEIASTPTAMLCVFRDDQRNFLSGLVISSYLWLIYKWGLQIGPWISHLQDG